MVFAATAFPLPMRKSKRRCSSACLGKRMLIGTCGASAIFFIARNYAPSRAKGEIDLIGFDGDTLVFVEMRTRTKEEGKIALPGRSITPEKHHALVRTAHYFLRERHPPVVRLHKAALSP